MSFRRKKFRALENWQIGVEYDKEKDQTRAPVIVLTGTELFAPHSLADSWKERAANMRSLFHRMDKSR